MHACLFDIDGTLVNTLGAGVKAFADTLASEFSVDQLSKKIDTAGRTDRSIARDLFELHEIEDGPQTWSRFLEAFVVHLEKSLAERKGTVLPGISRLLEQLAPRNDVALGLLTGNVREGARLKLEHYGLFHHFAFGAYGDEHLERSSVAEEAFSLAREHAGHDVPTDRVWVIGDTPRDIHCARSIGANVIAVATGSYTMSQLAKEHPDMLISDLSDPEPVLALLDS